MYKEFIIIFSIIIIHELGHLLISKIYNWNLDKIEIYPFGGCIKFNEKINRPLIEEIFILIGGPLTQIILFLIITFIYKNGFISYRNYLLFKSYHKTLLIFNLLPIYPLDGGKILNCILNYFIPFKKSNKLEIIISFIIIVFIIMIYKDINYITMMILLIIELIIYRKQQDFLLNRLLLERYLFNYNFKNKKIIKNPNDFYKEKTHLIRINKKYIEEKDYLKIKYGG